LRPKVGALNLVVLLNLTPGFIAYRAGNIDFQSHTRHKSKPFNAERAEKTDQQSKTQQS
jgi:hypothetical protein